MKKFTKSIGFNILFSMIALVCITITVIYFTSLYITMRISEKNATTYTSQLVNEINNQVENYITYMQSIADFVSFSPDIKNYLMGTGSLEEANQQLSTILNVRSDVINIFMFCPDGRTIKTKDYIQLNPNNDYKNKDWYIKAVEAKGKSVISSSHVQMEVLDDYRWVISLSKAVMDDNDNVLGVLLINLRYDVISDLCSNVTLGNDGYLFILADNGDIVYHPYQQLIYSNIKKDMITEISAKDDKLFTLNDRANHKSYTVVSSENINWKVVGVYNIDEIIPDKKRASVIYAYIFIFTCCMAVIFAISLSKRLSSPITKLTKAMKRIKKGNMDMRVNIISEDEIGDMANVFNMMMDTINELMEKTKETMEQRRKSEIKALQAQINPHFLYNTLDTIVWMAEAGDSEEVVEITMALSKLFRTSISKSDELIPLYSEIDNINSYLTIQKMRYKNSLSYSIDIPDEIKNCLVIKLILQPIVENAVYHGIRAKGHGSVKISGYDAGDDFIISIEDDGVGMSNEDIEKILSAHGSNSGIGVYNVNERIKLYFGNEYGLSFSSKPGKNTKVTILLPKKEG